MNNILYKFRSNSRKLDFKDVLIVPKKTYLSSRKDVNLNREFYFKNQHTMWKGCPIISANMDTVSNLDTFNVLKDYNYLTCFPKHFNNIWYSMEQLPIKELSYVDNYMLSCGTNENDKINLINIISRLKDNHINVKFVCVDVANGYMNTLGDTCKKIRDWYPNIILVAGNVVTPEIVEDLIIDCGVNIVKCGIGGGCFSKDTRVLMANGTYKNISNIKVGDFVINRDGESVRVKNVINNGIKDVFNIKTKNWYDNIYVTGNHQFWTNDEAATKRMGFKRSMSAPSLWKALDDIDSRKNFTLLPKTIKWDLPEKLRIDMWLNNEEIEKDETYINIKDDKMLINRFIESSYDLGYIVGNYLLNGQDEILFLDDEKMYYKIVNSLKNVFGSKYNFEINKFEMDNIDFNYIKFENKYIEKVLKDFVEKRGLKSKYYCKDIFYIRGIFDALIDCEGSIETSKELYNIYSFGNSNNKMIELFNWCCMNLGYSLFVSEDKKKINKLKAGQTGPYYYVRTHSNNSKKMGDYMRSSFESKIPSIAMETWDIEVDCPTHSFIANNSIVHNSVCETRLKAGVGYPQLSCVLECAEAAHKAGGYIISDGGIIYPCDLVKAFAGGADFVMGGSIFAGHNESPGETIVDSVTNKRYKLFYGMSSKEAVDKYNNGMKDYRTSEGKVVKIPIKGDLKDTILDINGGIRSACTYVNARNIGALYDNTQFILVNSTHNTSLGGWGEVE